MIRVLLDTGVLCVLAVPSDQLHPRAQEEQEVLWGQGYAGMVLYPTLLETQRRILQRTYPQFARAWFEAVLEELNPINTRRSSLSGRGKAFEKLPRPEDHAARCRARDRQPRSGYSGVDF